MVRANSAASPLPPWKKVPFIGAIVEPPIDAAVIFQYCSRHSLKDILERSELRLDLKFKVRIGLTCMTYPHNATGNAELPVANRWAPELNWLFLNPSLST